jgi:hypothetical protein
MAMRLFHPFARRPWSLGVVALSGAVLAAGCDGVGRRCPVTGRVLVNGVPLQGKTGSVVFKPDAAQGNPSRFEAVGEINAEGNYTLFTKGKPGVPPGRYKVIVTAGEPGRAQVANRTAGRQRNAPPPPVIPPRYADEGTSGLVKEVVTDPAGGAYDLDLANK